MKQCILFIVFLMVACNSPDGPDCIKKSGRGTTRHFEVPSFNRIAIKNQIILVVKDSSSQSVRIKTGKNLLDNIDVKVTDNQLTIKNNNDCNWVRGYKKTKVFVSSPQLKSIRNGSHFDVISDGTLHYDSLELISEDYQSTDKYHTDGNFKLTVDCQSLKITSNFISNFFLTGKTDTFTIDIYGGDGRVEAQDLELKDAQIYHRGSNDIIISPSHSVSGKLVSTGNLILMNVPSEVDVETLYKGDVIYE